MTRKSQFIFETIELDNFTLLYDKLCFLLIGIYLLNINSLNYYIAKILKWTDQSKSKQRLFLCPT